MQKAKVTGQSVQTIEWKETEVQMDWLTDGCDCITSHANVVGNNWVMLQHHHYQYVNIKHYRFTNIQTDLWHQLSFKQ